MPAAPRDLVHRFMAADAFLKRHEDLWRPRPFIGEDTPWEARLPALSAWVRALSPDHLERWEAHPDRAPGAPTSLKALYAESHALGHLPHLTTCALPALPQPLTVPARKWQQVLALLQAALPHLKGATALLDWCSGKSHLGRTAAQLTGLPVQAMEREAALVAEGEALARRHGATVHFSRLDLESDPPLQAPPTGTALLALHACGDLTDRALDFCLQHEVHRLMVAPCCYHAIKRETYHPRSQAGRASGLALSRAHLRLPSAEEVVTSQRGRRLRRVEMVYRAALDDLLRQGQAIGAYQPHRSVPKSWITGDLAEFIHHMARRDGLLLPRNLDLAGAEARGRAHVHQARCLGLVRAPFRRPIELWIALDRALSLQERGWEVSLGTFCPRELTPRNLLLLGLRGP